MSWRALIVLFALFGSAACSPGDDALGEPSGVPPADVLAVYEGGEVTRTQFDAAILALPPAARVLPRDTDADAWIEERIRALALNDLMLRAALDSGREDEAEFQHSFEEALREAAARHYLARELPAAEPPDEAELRRRFDAQPARAFRPEMRLVHHWFLRLGPARSAEAARAELGRLRERYLAGESFADLARSHSESQTRHTGGSLGWLSREALPAGLAAVIFEVGQGAASQPVEHGPGLHVFLVERVLPEQHLSFEELRGPLAQEWLQEQQSRAIDTILAGLPLPAGSTIPSAPEAFAILRHTDDPELPVLRIGDFVLSAGELMQRVQMSDQARPGRHPESVVAEVLRAVAVRERVALLGDDVVESPVEPEARQALRHALLVQHHQQRELRRMAEEADLDAWYATHRARFSTPLRVELRGYRVPDGPDPNLRMARLESWWSEGAERAALEELVREWGGEIEEVGWRTIPQLVAEGFPAAPLVSDLAAGKMSPPYRIEGHVQVTEVLAREEPAPRELDEVREAVVAGYLQENGQALFAAWSGRLLEEAGYRSFPDHFPQRVSAATGDDADR